MPTNLYGPNDNFNLKTSHVPAAFLRRFHEAKIAGLEKVTMWGTGSPGREFLHVDDLAEACLVLLERYDSAETISVGCGEDVSIKELAELVQEDVGFNGEIDWDHSKPDGIPRKLLGTSRPSEVGWTLRILLKGGLSSPCEWYRRAISQTQRYAAEEA